jgi:hypothetical protein
LLKITVKKIKTKELDKKKKQKKKNCRRKRKKNCLRTQSDKNAIKTIPSLSRKATSTAWLPPHALAQSCGLLKLIASKLAVFGCPKQHGFVLPYQKQVMVMNFVFKNVVAYFF